MGTGVFSVYDSKAESYLPPFFARNRASAIRSFTAAVLDPGSDLNRFPEDYVLFDLGKWDDESAQFSLFDSPESVVTAWAIAAAAKREVK